MAESILIVGQDRDLCGSLKRLLMSEGYDVDTVDDAESALKSIEEGIYDLVITDIVLKKMDGLDLTVKIRELLPDLPVVVMTSEASLDTAVKALRAGACDYLTVPIMKEETKRIFKGLARDKELRERRLIFQRHTVGGCDFGKIVGKSEEISHLINEVRKVANSTSSVLLFGETGTGKELFAKALHHCSARREKPFIPINCSAIPENLLESELFGYVKGAFTGATGTKRGLFEEADSGTLFLDEIGDLSLQLQTKLLRVLDDREIRPIGGVQTRKVNVRFISATNKDLAGAVKDGRFREDLYYRINVITIKLPPLRDRRGDVKVLAEFFLEKFSAEIGKSVKAIDERVMDFLAGYHWPGNVRELQNIIERSVLLADSDFILPEHLPEELRGYASFTGESINQVLSIEDYTKGFILKHQSRCSEQELARILGITRKALWEKRKKWNIRKN